MSYYSKYRPQTIAELDLEAVRKSLGTILTSGKFSQVYLFTGPKGTGKTSSARILAKLLNCEKNRKTLHEPCNECDSCRRITSGHSLACLEMDAASNRGIDDVRQLKERAGLAPAEGLFTVYIIDEVHMLTTEAFNALLKTLEEPPKHAVFILCTTDPQKIPETVISRCTRVHFNKATAAEIAHSLKKAIEGEDLKIEAEAVAVLADRVDGSFRDGMKLLEQLASLGGKITKTGVDEMTGFGESYAAKKLIQALLSKDITGALTEIEIKQQAGVDSMVWGKRLMEELRAVMIGELTGGDRQRATELVKLSKLMAETVVKLRGAVMPFALLEIAAGEWCLQGVGQVVKVQKVEPVKQSKPAPAPVMPVTVRADTYTGTLDDITKKWPEILLAVRPINHSIEALLKSTRLITYEDGWLTVEAYYKFHKETLEQERHRRRIEELMSQVLGGHIKMKITVSGKNGNTEMENVSGKVEDDVLVKAAEEIFGA